MQRYEKPVISRSLFALDKIHHKLILLETNFTIEALVIWKVIISID